MRTRLTKRVVTDLAPANSAFIAWDTAVPGFGVRVHPTGRKTFLFGYRLRGDRRFRKVALGGFPTLTVEAARQMAREHVTSRGLGVDPATVRKSVAPAGKTSLTVEAAVEAYLKRSKASERYKREGKAMLSRYIVPALGSVPLAELKRDRVRDLHHEIGADHCRPIMANRVLALLSAVCRRAVEDEAMLRNPCQGVERFQEKGKERFLSATEQAAFHTALDTAARDGLPQPPTARRRRGRPERQAKPAPGARRRRGGQPGPRPADPYAIAALRFLLLSGCRLREVLALKWSEVDPAGYLRLERTKTGRQVRPVGAAALALLDKLPRQGRNPYVFQGRKTGTHLQSLAVLWAAVQHAAGLEGVRLHDLRHTYASNAAEAGVPLQVIGALLGHRRPETTARYSHLTDETVRQAADLVASRGQKAKAARANPQ